MKPMLFNSDMVRALLDGRKTVTRRVVRPQPKAKLAYVCMGHKHGTWSYADANAWKYWEDGSFRLPDSLSDADKGRRWTPPCCAGDILYVRETWRIWKAHRYEADAHIEYKAGKDGVINGTILHFPFGYTDSTNRDDYDRFIGKWEVGEKWNPSIHMPKEAARIFLRVTNVRVEELRPMGLDDFEAEGLSTVTGLFDTTARFADIWDSTIKPADRANYGWDANPWVWVIAFERCEKPEVIV